MRIHWLTVFIDLPTDRFDRGASFWQEVTESERSAPSGADEQFATLVPRDGDAYVCVQRTSAGPRIHLDLHVDSISAARRTAEQVGATVDADLGHVIMRSPTGMTFCLVPHRGESRRPAPVHEGREHRLDQVCIDVPAALIDREVGFWQTLTGWDLRRGRLQEFTALAPPPGSPLRLLFQQLGTDDGAEASRAHLDVACGRRVDDVRQLHEGLGAEFVAQGRRWTTMRDPAGMSYCLTERDPITGQIE